MAEKPTKRELTNLVHEVWLVMCKRTLFYCDQCPLYIPVNDEEKGVWRCKVEDIAHRLGVDHLESGER